VFVLSNARDNGISKGRLKNRIVMDVCEFCCSPINSLKIDCGEAQSEIPTPQNGQALFRDNHFQALGAVLFSHSLISSLKIVCGEAQNKNPTA